MNIIFYISAACYMLVILLLVMAGIRFLTAAQIMPYHLTAMGT